MPQEKYAQAVVEQCFDLLVGFLNPGHQTEIAISNRALSMILKRVEEHLAKGFESDRERIVFRQLRSKLADVSTGMFSGTILVKEAQVFGEEGARKLLDEWCKPPEFE